MRHTRLHTPALLALLALLLLSSCAKQGYPSGGPKDTAPPKALGTKPDNESRRFAASEFYIAFDEYVVLRSPDDNVLVSPPLAQKPEYITKGRGVLVRLKDTLQPNTTYLFQFKEAIADFTEGNLLPSYEYVFSTGEGMDTMMLAGHVTNARDGKPWSETLTVMAFRPGDSTAALVTRTDKNGGFAFHYIPQGSYRLIAVEDKNKNLVVDSAEAAAWDTTYRSAVDSIDSTRLASLRISAPDRRKQRLLKAEFTERAHVVVSTALPMKQPRLEGEPHRMHLNATGDTLHIWCLNEQCDSTVFVLNSDEGLHDTLRLRYRQMRGGKGRNSAATPARKPLMQPLCDGNKAFYDSLMLAFTRPVRANRDMLMAEVMNLKDSTVGRCPLTLDADGLTARIDTTLRSGEDYSIRLEDSLFIDLYGHPSDSLFFKLKPKDYGTLTLDINNRTGQPLVVEVLDKRDTVVQSQRLAASGRLRFSHLTGGDYRLRAVIDSDGDGRWTTGDYHLGRQPEEHRMFDKTLNLREKWEMEEQWTVGGAKAIRGKSDVMQRPSLDLHVPKPGLRTH
jgi:hypothetical protein